MIEYQKEAILISFLNEKDKYKRLADYIVHLIKEDPLLPKESLHTIIYRIKDEFRLIEKIDKHNNELEAGEPAITEDNYQTRISDLLGVRMICLRLSDITKVEIYLRLLSEENIINFVKEPDHKRSFILPLNPVDLISDDIDLRYGGYSSIHYQMELGDNSGAPPRLEGLQFELQLRTILEEAWSEIDHKYRYVKSRADVKLPEHINMGFYTLSAYLQVAALHAEHLSHSVEVHSLKMIAKIKGKDQILQTNEICIEFPSSEIENILLKTLGFIVTPRTMVYIEKRLMDINSAEKPQIKLQKLLSKNRLIEFKDIYQDIFGTQPFSDAKKRNIDLINILNYAIFYELQGERVAQEGLRGVLRWRKDRSIC